MHVLLDMIAGGIGPGWRRSCAGVVALPHQSRQVRAAHRRSRITTSGDSPVDTISPGEYRSAPHRPCVHRPCHYIPGQVSTEE